MKKKKQQVKPKTKESNTAGVILGSLVVSTLILLLLFVCKMAYDDIVEPSYDTCYVSNYRAETIARIYSVYNKKEVTYNLVDLEDIPTKNINTTYTEDFLDNYTKLPDCSAFTLGTALVEQRKRTERYIEQLEDSITGSKR